jgi:hypothetical protein
MLVTWHAGARDPAQRQVSFVQIAHCRHERDARKTAQAVGQIGGGSDDLHVLPRRRLQ